MNDEIDFLAEKKKRRIRKSRVNILLPPETKRRLVLMALRSDSSLSSVVEGLIDGGYRQKRPSDDGLK